MTCHWNFCRIQVWLELDCGKGQICPFGLLCLCLFLCVNFLFLVCFCLWLHFCGLVEHTSHLSHGDRSGKEQELCKPAMYRAFHPAVSAVQAPRLTLKHNDQRQKRLKETSNSSTFRRRWLNYRSRISCKSLASLCRQLFENWRLYSTDSIVGSLWTFLTWLPGWPHIYHYLIIGYWWYFTKSFWAQTKLLWNG